MIIRLDPSIQGNLLVIPGVNTIMADYLVTLNEPGKYNVGVDYEIPSKSIQYGNIIIGKTPLHKMVQKQHSP